jgi:hypothetical protein
MLALFQAVYIHKKTDGALRNEWGEIMRRRVRKKRANKECGTIVQKVTDKAKPRRYIQQFRSWHKMPQLSESLFLL